MGNLFQEPYPFISIKKRALISVLISIFVFVFLASLQPFDLNRIESNNKIFVISGYGFIVLISMLLLYILLPELWRSLFNKKDWKVYKELVWISAVLILIGFGVAVYDHILGHRSISLFPLFESITKTFIIGIIPVTALVLINQLRLLKKNLAEAVKINSAVSSKSKHSPSVDSKITLTFNGAENDVSFELMDLAYISALGNYVELNLLKEGKTEKKILRSPLKNILDQLSSYPSIFHCHRSYAINTQQEFKVSGDSRGIEINFAEFDHPVPVSKRKISEFKRLMNG